jgi:PAS domain S-box-containing protein
LFQAAQRELDERKLAEERLEEEKNLLGTIINNIPDFIYAKDLEGHFVVANAAIASFFGFESPADILGKTIGDLFPGDVGTEYLEEERQILSFEKTVLNQEENVVDKVSGKPKCLLVTKMALPDTHGHIVGIVGIDRDITARKHAEDEVKRYLAEVEVANEEVKTFAYIVSHDLRAPLVNLKGFSSELKDSMEILAPHLQKLIEGLDESEREEVVLVLDEDIPEALGFIETSVSRMDGFINSVLKLSRIGRRQLTVQPVDVAPFVDTCRQSLAHQMEDRQVELIVNDLPEVLADPTALEQVIGNLLTNAVNYLDPTRPGRIEIGGEKTPLGTKFWIKDNGRGISKDDEEKVFAPFRRAGKQDVKGEGMGLSYVRTMVRQHGGQIWFESEPDVGTTFFFTIADQQEGK